MPGPDGRQWITVTDVAVILGVSPHTVRALIEREELHAESFVPTDRPRRRRVVRLRREDVDDYLEHARVTPGQLAHLYPGDATPTTGPRRGLPREGEGPRR